MFLLSFSSYLPVPSRSVQCISSSNGSLVEVKLFKARQVYKTVLYYKLNICCTGDMTEGMVMLSSSACATRTRDRFILVIFCRFLLVNFIVCNVRI